ncbi:lipopolysaccharide assembly protein LapB [Chloracidobacterium aggregatum]|uniref:tetratricopeptide repeat protein n=1 Tax=Chloracidobacterium aggregatum TaxID=2851959 RepID=UPI001B8D5184|nr:tetratricopeptide repeat protein [Chloracidobacterium aggregatum]QUV85195.1 tetratricopeptide repeat protein [Chloracidobacterium sp. 2]QUV91323.1 tetratricopeptide repeat protein [Chloracidobacterium sp. A]
MPPASANPSAPGTPPGKRPSPPRRPAIVKTPTGVAMPLGRPAEFYFEEGNELFDKGDFVSARMFFEQGGKAARPKSDLAEVLQRRREVSAHMAVGMQFERESQLVEALAEYDKALALEPVNPVAKRHAGQVLQMLGKAAMLTKDWQAAIGYLRRAQELAPEASTQAALVTSLLRLAMEQSDPTEAQRTYRQVLEIAPGNEDARLGLRRTEAQLRTRQAEAAFQSGRYNEARSEYEAALELDPEHAPASAGKTKVEGYLARQSADEAYRRRDFRAAYADYQKFQTVVPDDPQVTERLQELSLRLEPPLPLRGSLIYKLNTASPFRIRLHRDQVENALLDSENPIKPDIKLEGRLPAREAVFRLGKSSANVTVRIAVMPVAGNDYTAELIATPKNPRSEDVIVVAEWQLPLKGGVQWKRQLEPGAYRVYWQGPFFEVFDPTGVCIESSRQSPLPRQPVTVKVKPIKGVTVQVVEQPNPGNDFTFALNLAVTSPTLLLLDLSWDAGKK